MAKKVKRTRKKTTRKRSVKKKTAPSVDLGDLADPEIVVHEPEIDLGNPTDVPADHLVDDHPVAIDLGPSHVRDKDADPVPATAPAVLGPRMSQIAHRRRIKMWVWIAMGGALLIGVILLPFCFQPEEPLVAAQATVEGKVLLTDASRSILKTDGEKAVIPVGSKIETRGPEAAALHLSSGWVIWLKPGTSLKVHSVVPDLEVELLSGSLGADGHSLANWLIIRLGEPGREIRALMSRFTVEIGPQVRVVVARGKVETFDSRHKPLDLEVDHQMAWGEGASAKPVKVSSRATTGWMSAFPRVQWIPAVSREFTTYTSDGYEGDVSRFECGLGGDRRPVLTNKSIADGEDKLIVPFLLKDNKLRVTTRFRLQATGNEKAAVGLIFGYDSDGEYFAALYMPSPLPRLLLSRRGGRPSEPKVFPLIEPLSPIMWHTLTVEVVDKLVAITLNDQALGEVELDEYRRGQTGLIVENAQAQWKSFVLKEPRR